MVIPYKEASLIVQIKMRRKSLRRHLLDDLLFGLLIEHLSEFFSNSKKSFFQIAKIPIESRHKKGDRQKLTDRLSLRSTTIKHLHRAAYQVALA